MTSDLIEDLSQQLRAHPTVLPQGAGTKAALSKPLNSNFHRLDLTALTGIVEYEPEEFTLTALAGTPLREVVEALAQHDQYLPFDPPLVESGATLGGTVASGLSGSGRYRYGGVRDFLIGIRFLDGRGRLVRGGGKVVKNAAGFDLPKLLVGSLGRLGVLIELTFKVFPRPRARQTLCVLCENLEIAIETMTRLGREDWGCEAVDLEPNGQLWLRFAGDIEAIEAQSDLLEQTLRNDIKRWPATPLSGTPPIEPDTPPNPPKIPTAPEPWEAWSEWRANPLHPQIPEGLAWIKIPITPRRILALETALRNIRTGRQALEHRYSVGGHVLWLAWPEEELDSLDRLLDEQKLSGLNLLRSHFPLMLGRKPGNPLLDRIRQALDPEQRFLPLA